MSVLYDIYSKYIVKYINTFLRFKVIVHLQTNISSSLTHMYGFFLFNEKQKEMLFKMCVTDGVSTEKRSACCSVEERNPYWLKPHETKWHQNFHFKWTIFLDVQYVIGATVNGSKLLLLSPYNSLSVMILYI